MEGYRTGGSAQQPSLLLDSYANVTPPMQKSRRADSDSFKRARYLVGNPLLLSSIANDGSTYPAHSSHQTRGLISSLLQAPKEDFTKQKLWGGRFTGAAAFLSFV